jgi:hypothetical protein
MSALRNGFCVSWVAVAAAATAMGSVGTPKTEFRQLYALAPNGRVLIQNLYGDVSITAWDRDEVLVEAIKHSTDPRQLDDARIIVEPSSGMLSIHTQYGGADAEHPASVEYRITVPRTANLENVRLVNGGLSLSGLSGPVKASSVNGSIKAEKLEGGADLSTVNGRLEANFDRIARTQPITLSSVNGPIKLSIPATAGVSLNARNISGGIASDVGHVSRSDGAYRLHTINRNGPQIHLDNVNGGISIHACLTRKTQRVAF